MTRHGRERMDHIGQVEKLLQDARGNSASVTDILATMVPWDVVTLIGRATPQRASELFRLLPEPHIAPVFEKLKPTTQKEIITSLGGQDALTLFAELDPDDRVRLLDELQVPLAERLLLGLSAEARDVTTSILEHPIRSVGHRMSPEYVHAYPQITVGETLESVRSQAHRVESVYVIPVTDDSNALVGVVSLRDLMIHDSETTIAQILKPAESVRADDDAETAARVCTELQLLAMPVVDESSRLVGIFTLDDALRTLEDAETEDIARAGGSEPLRRPYLPTPTLRVARSRVVWLLVLAVSALLTVQVLGVFEATLEEKVVLALFIPLLTGTGGNTGAQAATTVTRALAIGDVRSGDLARVLSKEVRVGTVLGLLLGLLGFILAWIFFDFRMGLVIGLTLMLICTMAATVGGAMPMLARSIRVDPAVFSTPFITTFCDATGLVIYFTIAKAVLGI